MTLNWIWWWNSVSGSLGCVKNSYTAITLFFFWREELHSSAVDTVAVFYAPLTSRLKFLLRISNCRFYFRVPFLRHIPSKDTNKSTEVSCLSFLLQFLFWSNLLLEGLHSFDLVFTTRYEYFPYNINWLILWLYLEPFSK